MSGRGGGHNILSPESALAADFFEQFVSAGTFKATLGLYRQICELLRIRPSQFPNFYPRLKAKLRSWKAASLWAKLDKRASHKCYARGKACQNTKVLIIGAGPCGLRCAIEAQLLGAKVVVVDKRDRFSRNNVLHLWPFVINDLRQLGAKKFFGKFCAGSIDHISIRQLQLILLKVALLLGVEVHENVAFKSVIEPPLDQTQEKIGWRAQFSVPDHLLSNYEFDVLIGADGKRNTLQGFNRKEFRGKLAIAITANFLNRHSPGEARVPEISGVAFIFNQKFFQDMRDKTGINLENIVYYKDDTHYFVMTAKKHSLLMKGVIIEDYTDTARLLAPENVNKEALMKYAREAANFATGEQLPQLEFAVNHYGQADVAMFDFTSMYAAENACRVVERRGHKLLQGLVGDSLLEPFWPTGSGCARGFLSAFDMAWMCRSWASGKMTTLQVLAEREGLYRLLAQTKPENLHKNFNQYTLNPSSRYPNLNSHSVLPSQLRSLYDTDNPEAIDLSSHLPDIIPLPRKKVKRESTSGSINPVTLLAWCRKNANHYPNVNIVDLGPSWTSGLPLCAILHRFHPGLLDFRTLNASDAEFNNQLAFNICEQEFSIPSPMTGKEMAECGTPSPQLMLGFLARIYETFRGETPFPYPMINIQSSHKEPREKDPLATNAKDFLDNYPYKPKKNQVQEEHKFNEIKILSSRKKNKVYSRDLGGSQLISAIRRSLNYKASVNTKVRVLEEKIRKDAGLHEDMEMNGEEEDPESQERLTPRKIDLQEFQELEQRLANPDAFRKVMRTERVRYSKLRKDDYFLKIWEDKMKPKSPTKDPLPERPKICKEIFGDKIQKMSQRLQADGGMTEEEKAQFGEFNNRVKRLAQRLRDGTSTDVGERGRNYVTVIKDHMDNSWNKADRRPGQNILPPPVCNPVTEILREFSIPRDVSHHSSSVSLASSTSSMKAQSMPNSPEPQLSTLTRRIPSNAELTVNCHFCDKTVKLAERASAEGLQFHHSCFKCNFCDFTLSTARYSYDKAASPQDKVKKLKNLLHDLKRRLFHRKNESK